ncbi:hypothetical protein GQ607_011275 [Colletotrichum asianum]|uniref:Uncharacterized protein n=1 Tax=Colletotrichum asianum TaxID=702518 RepID=A0A8H3W8J0_9PEZI|nr:hypothetical protein GQ607_011275 [Colletotrichum asianum]
MVMVVHPSFISAAQSTPSPAHEEWGRRESGERERHTAQRAMEANKDLLLLCVQVPQHRSGRLWKVGTLFPYFIADSMAIPGSKLSTAETTQEAQFRRCKTRTFQSIERDHGGDAGRALGTLSGSPPQWTLERPNRWTLADGTSPFSHQVHLPAPSEASMEHCAAVCGRANRNLRNLWTGEPVVPWVRPMPQSHGKSVVSCRYELPTPSSNPTQHAQPTKTNIPDRHQCDPAKPGQRTYSPQPTQHWQLHYHGAAYLLHLALSSSAERKKGQLSLLATNYIASSPDITSQVA